MADMESMGGVCELTPSRWYCHLLHTRTCRFCLLQRPLHIQFRTSHCLSRHLLYTSCRYDSKCKKHSSHHKPNRVYSKHTFYGFRSAQPLTGLQTTSKITKFDLHPRYDHTKNLKISVTWERPNWIPISRWEFAKYSHYTKHTRDMLNCVSLNNVTTYDGHQCTWIVAPPRPCWVCWVLRTCTHTAHLLHVGTGKSDGSKGRMHQVGHSPLVYKTYHKPNDPLCSSGIQLATPLPD